MLDDSMKATIADFGMSENLIDKPDREEDENEAGPLKHMAPESIKSKKFSKESDIWAFGVTVFEIATAAEPHANVLPFQVALMVAENGMKPEFPADLKESFSSAVNLMDWCCSFKPEDRPSMNEVAEWCASNLS
jgi:serine/threonine protein kinase